MIENPRITLEKSSLYFKKRDGKTIVEIGCIRNLDQAYALQDGHSSKIWQKVAKRLYCVDIDEKACEITRAVLPYPNVFVYNMDGFDFVAGFGMMIDLLYLDAMAPDASESAEFHLKVYEIARDRGLLHDKSMILIDDTQFEAYGKGARVIPQAIADGYKIEFTGRQTLLIKR
jgi:hypothetical protein